ncbi:hypothetical protein L2E82_21067 [Cichorium intybus]|uniref:Uncharacterized protein n=1 Tax=Cichorium intybus TaxID=13427 RepID=A0ACB9DW20_CICIN|nr:hypothetical protein L2E82_21067 [Cichorium intybus]
MRKENVSFAEVVKGQNSKKNEEDFKENKDRSNPEENDKDRGEKKKVALEVDSEFLIEEESKEDKSSSSPNPIRGAQREEDQIENEGEN